MHFLSLNCRGLRGNDKRQQILYWCRKQKAQIIFLQETYWDGNIAAVVEKEWKGKAFHSFGTNHSRGVSILFDRNIECIVKKVKSDEVGRKILVIVELNRETFTLVI